MPITITHAHASKVTTPGRIYDTQRGLHLWVKSAANKYWIYRNARGGKRTDICLGAFPTLSTADARLKAAELHSLIAKGQNPLAERKRPQKLANESVGHAFQIFAEEYIKIHRTEWHNQKHAEQWANTLAAFAYPVIGEKDP